MATAPKMVGSNADAERMDCLQREIEKAILPYRENTEAILVAGALLRVARILIRLYSPDLRAGLLQAAKAYLDGAATLEGAGEPSALERLGFWVPPGSKH